MTDRELLEAAAKAAGVKYDVAASAPHPVSGAFWGLWLLFEGEPSEYARRYWNPLLDDGDALRLVVKLDMDVDVSFASNQVYSCAQGGKTCAEPLSGDKYAATRRAIVRAAAAMSESKA